MFRILPVLAVLWFLASCTGDQASLGHFNKAEESFASGKLQEAAKLYHLFLENELNSPWRITAWERLLQIHLDIGRDIERGISILQSMSLEHEIEKDMLWSIFMRLGKLYVHQRQFDMAIDMLKRSIDLAPDDEQLIQSYESLAEVHYKKLDYPMALAALYDFLEVNPDPSSGHFGRINYLLGKVYYQQKNLDMAIYYLRETLYSDAHESERSKAGMLLCDVYLDENNQQLAEEVIKELEKFYPNPMVIRTRLEGIQ